MSLARAIETGDLAELPSRRDEDWRWTDLRGLIREARPKQWVKNVLVFAAPGAAGRRIHGSTAGSQQKQKRQGERRQL